MSAPARCYVWCTARGGRSHAFLQFHLISLLTRHDGYGPQMMFVPGASGGVVWEDVLYNLQAVVQRAVASYQYNMAVAGVEVE